MMHERKADTVPFFGKHSSKLKKKIAEDKTTVPGNLKFVVEREENIVEKEENACHWHFFLFPHCFQKASFFGSLKLGTVW